MKTWYSKTNGMAGQGLVIDESTGKNIAVTYDAKDAPLVAAAPKMLEALKRLADASATVGNLDHAGATVPNEAWSEMYAANNYARAAIAEAESEPV